MLAFDILEQANIELEAPLQLIEHWHLASLHSQLYDQNSTGLNDTADKIRSIYWCLFMLRFLRDLTTSHDATSKALTSPEEAEKNLQAHFENIQRISDSTTLPQMLGELEKGLERVASIDVILSELRWVLPPFDLWL